MTTKADLEDQLKELKDKVDSQPPNFDPKKHETRAKIAIFVVRSYFILLGAVLIGVPLYNLVANSIQALSVNEIISTLSSATSGIFGFVVGYYFKGSE